MSYTSGGSKQTKVGDFVEKKLRKICLVSYFDQLSFTQIEAADFRSMRDIGQYDSQLVPGQSGFIIRCPRPQFFT